MWQAAEAGVVVAAMSAGVVRVIRRRLFDDAETGSLEDECFVCEVCLPNRVDDQRLDGGRICGTGAISNASEVSLATEFRQKRIADL